MAEVIDLGAHKNEKLWDDYLANIKRELMGHLESLLTELEAAPGLELNDTMRSDKGCIESLLSYYFERSKEEQAEFLRNWYENEEQMAAEEASGTLSSE